jgi:hypothetical protein
MNVLTNEVIVYLIFEVITAVTMKNAVFWDVAPYRCCELNQRSSETLVEFTRSIWRHIPEDGILHNLLFG